MILNVIYSGHGYMVGILNNIRISIATDHRVLIKHECKYEE